MIYVEGCRFKIGEKVQIKDPESEKLVDSQYIGAMVDGELVLLFSYNGKICSKPLKNFLPAKKLPALTVEGQL